MQTVQGDYGLAVKILKQATRILVTAGAGMGVDSGLPDFRGPSGFWKTYKSFSGKFSFVDCANHAFLNDHPNYFWGFYGHRLRLYRETTPHYGFQILKKIVQSPNVKDYFIVTSNVDGHFQKAGFPDNKVYEVHGSINHVQCSRCDNLYPADKINVEYDEETFEAKPPLPACKDCKRVIRPNILMFGDYDWDSSRSNAQETEYIKYKNKGEDKDTEVVLEIGAGHAVSTIRYMSETHLQHNKNCWLIRINPRDLKLSSYFGNLFADKDDRYIPIKENGLNALKEIEKQLELK